jgi:hypothetical protein
MKITSLKLGVAVLLEMVLSPALAMAHPVPSGVHERVSGVHDRSSRPHLHESVAHH